MHKLTHDDGQLTCNFIPELRVAFFRGICSATFRTLESVDGIIRSSVTEPVLPVPAPAATVNCAGA
ncbi:hypothetical protein I8H57_004641 [Enterobacter cloacae]|uniref:hypothetical protein n=1 Tax=Enterobacter cloacae TaxID=550 RepID=UPI0020D065AF|nr:hypothetical protein [Enterobacter cloacae]